METLNLGKNGAAVELLQLALSRAGYYTGELDGVFGPETYNSLRKFQQAFGLAIDGIAGPRVWAALMPYIKGYYTRRTGKGDTFWSLARAYNTTVRAIATANPTVDPENIQIGQFLVIPLGFPVVPTNITYSSALMGYITDGLRARYPFIKTGSIGSSVMGSPLYYLSIGKGSTHVFYNGAHHANEWITTPLLLKYFEEYSCEYSSGGRIGGASAERLYNHTTLYIVPMVDPDGVDLVNGVISAGAYYNTAVSYAQNYPAIPFPDGWKANISGVDLNLQYPADWMEARRIKFAQGYTSPAPRDYVGTAPLVAPESRAVYSFTRNHDFALTISYHSQGEVIYWRFKEYMPPKAFEIAKKMRDVSGYALEDVPAESANAGYKDWFIQEYNKPGYTIEVGLGTNPLPLSQFDRIYYNNIGIMTVGLTDA